MPSQGSMNWPIYLGVSWFGMYWYNCIKMRAFLDDPNRVPYLLDTPRPLPGAGEADPGPAPETK
jgi:hypothetical protein